jgi:3-oxoacyl-[acyl-carrier-protein] synthase III
MKSPNICYLDYSIPETKLMIEELAEKDDSVKKHIDNTNIEDFCKDFKTKTGIEYIAIGTRNDLLSIFSKMLEKLLDNYKIDPVEVKYLFYADEYNYLGEISEQVYIPYYLIQKFGLKKVTVIPIGSSCISTLVLMSFYAKGFHSMESGYSLLLSSSFMEQYKNRFKTFTVLGDGAAICLFSNNGNGLLNLCDGETFSDGVGSLSQRENNHVNRTPEGIMSTVKMIKHLLERNGLTKNDIDILIAPNANQFALFSGYAKLLGLPRNKIFHKNISNAGHLGDVDIIRNLKDFLDDKELIIQNKNILCYAMNAHGMDFTRGCALLKYTA